MEKEPTTLKEKFPGIRLPEFGKRQKLELETHPDFSQFQRHLAGTPDI